MSLLQLHDIFGSHSKSKRLLGYAVEQPAHLVIMSMIQFSRNWQMCQLTIFINIFHISYIINRYLIHSIV